MDDHTPPRESRGRTRRALLRATATATATVGALAGCLGAPTADEADAEREPTATPDPGSLASYGVPRTICEEEIRPDPNIPAIVDPTFAADWSGVDTRDYGPLDPETPVVGVERDGQARAYPVPVLTRHEIVNDTLGGPLLVTFCPLCNSGLVAERRVDGEETTFHVSGLLWKAPRVQSAAAAERGDVFGVNGIDPDAEVRSSGNLVMYDDLTESYWSQILARAICGSRTEEELTPLPARTTTWGEWRRDHETRVLLSPPHSETDGR